VGQPLGAPSVKDKQAVLDQFDEQLALLKVGSDERKEIKRPYVQLIGTDLYGLFYQTMERYVQWKETELRKGANSPDGLAGLQKFTIEVGEWRKGSSRGPFHDLENYDLQIYLTRATPEAVLDENNRLRVEKFRNEILTLYDACKAKGGYTKEAAEFVDNIESGGDSLKGIDRKLSEILGVPITFQ
jgi:hypothetical protein